MQKYRYNKTRYNKTRYNFLIYDGDYNKPTSTGIGFYLQNKNVPYDLHLAGDDILNTIEEWLNVSTIAEVIVNEDNDLIIIDSVETRIR